ncbi:DUF3316 domain-containing protein [Leucothrix arctica]|uniref:DUF3316 domain-containing protein n=1 Tax=Leucothrix arctica TaxID=1481894 RepID=A0A317C4A2_9GAMM|nr:DUF3316 domain-containing protein [Leucothrix arctica]PWQ93137.1 hypothetical protein DKT75_20830 [Leucothrix arctica]
MKTLTSLLVTSVLLISATAANASNFERHSKDILTTETASSRAEAYQLGTSKLSQLQSASPRQLFNELDIFSIDAVVSSAHLEDGSFVTVQERMGANGKLGYVGLVNVDVSYNEERDDD